MASHNRLSTASEAAFAFTSASFAEVKIYLQGTSARSYARRLAQFSPAERELAHNCV
jgi:hypothetical protein